MAPKRHPLPRQPPRNALLSPPLSPPPPPLPPPNPPARAASDTDADHLISRAEFPSFIFHMASADLRSVSSMATPAGPGAQVILPPRMTGPGPQP